MSALNGQLDFLGQGLFFWQTPDGYPDTVEYWSGNIVPRWEFANTRSSANYKTASHGQPEHCAISRGHDGRGDQPDRDELLRRRDSGRDAHGAARASLDGGTFDDTRVRETLGLAIAAAEFQWY